VERVDDPIEPTGTSSTFDTPTRRLSMGRAGADVGRGAMRRIAGDAALPTAGLGAVEGRSVGAGIVIAPNPLLAALLLGGASFGTDLNRS